MPSYGAAACVAKCNSAISGPRYSQLLAEAIREGNAVGNLAFDAQVVALCREHGVSALLTEDRDFDRFRGLRTERLGVA